MVKLFILNLYINHHMNHILITQTMHLILRVQHYQLDLLLK